MSLSIGIMSETVKPVSYGKSRFEKLGLWCIQYVKFEKCRGKRSQRIKEEMGNKGRRKRRECLLGLIRVIIGHQSI